MQQLQLFEAQNYTQKNISTNTMKAAFRKIQDSCYEVVLEVSSNKFLIQIKEIAGKIEQFEIVAIKSFMELTRKTISLLRCLTEHFFVRLGN